MSWSFMTQFLGVEFSTIFFFDLKIGPTNLPIFSPNLEAFLYPIILFLFYLEPISIKHILVFIIMGTAGLLAHWCMTQALKFGDTTYVMPLQFTKLIWASLIGLFLFSFAFAYYIHLLIYIFFLLDH